MDPAPNIEVQSRVAGSPFEGDQFAELGLVILATPMSTRRRRADRDAVEAS